MKNLASGLVNGVQNIDRMKKEIRLVVDTVVNPCLDDLHFLVNLTNRRRELRIITGGSPQWTLSLVPNKWSIACSTRIMRSTDREREDLGAGDVAKVYDSLPSFVEGMIKIFPRLTDELQPFLDVADREF